jgi:plasmid stability protein
MKHEATDLLIRKVDPKLKNELKKRARAHGRSLSDEVKAILDKDMKGPAPQRKMGTWMFSLLPEEFRGDDLVFEVPDQTRKPPDFE